MRAVQVNVRVGFRRSDDRAREVPLSGFETDPIRNGEAGV
jgi:hypothetical protein